MWGLVLGAVRARTAQVVTVFVLSVLVTTAAAAGPWWLTAAEKKVAAADVAAAPPTERLVSVRRVSGTAGRPEAALTEFRASVERLLPVRDSTATLGMIQTLVTPVGAGTRDAPVAYREDVCAHLRITGSCPVKRDEALISQATADLLSLNVGDPFPVSYVPGSSPTTLTVVGRYELLDPSGDYWGDPLFTRDAPANGAAGPLDPTFVPVASFGHTSTANPTFGYTTRVPAAMLAGDNVDQLAERLRSVDFTLHQEGFLLYAPTQGILSQVGADRDAVRRGVEVGTAQVIALCWLAMAMAGRYTARDRRGDVALLKLRGSTRGRVLALTVGQHLVPIVAALPVGVALGWLCARLLAGPVPPAGAPGWSWLLVAGALLGGLVALLLAEVATLWTPVGGLLRSVAGRRRGWRGDIADLVLVAIAGAAVYQAHTGGAVGFALVAPALVALAVVVLVARLLGVAADRAGGGALRAGRLTFGLAAVQVSRQPGADRIFALVAVAVAILGTAADGFLAGSSARAARADVELGADRVLTVQTANRTSLLHAVRQADPGGRTAMAVVANLTASPPVLAVDATRLAAVATWRADYGRLPSLTAGPALPTARITGGRVTLRARNNGPAPVSLLVTVENEVTGLDQSVLVGPIAPGDAQIEAPLRGCATAAGCRILRLDLDLPSALSSQSAPADRGASLTIREIGQRDPDQSILDGAALGDPRRWRSGETGPVVTVAARQDTLTLTMPDTEATPDNRAFVVDTPLPVPVVVAGPHQPGSLVSDPVLVPFGGNSMPVRVAGIAAVLPVVGRDGILVDLESAQRVVAASGNGGTFEVWLAPGAGRAVVDRLRAAGLTVIADRTRAGRAGELAVHGPALAVRYQVFTGLIELLLAAAALTVATTVERAARAGELGALRVQGLRGRTAVLAAYTGSAALIVLGVAAGVFATVVAFALGGAVAPPFNDGWTGLAPPGGLVGAALAGTALLALLVLGLLWWLAAAPLGRRLRGEPR